MFGILMTGVETRHLDRSSELKFFYLSAGRSGEIFVINLLYKNKDLSITPLGGSVLRRTHEHLKEMTVV